MRRIQSFIEEVTDYVLLPLALIAIIVVGSLYFYFSVGDIPRVAVLPSDVTPGTVEVVTDHQIFKDLLQTVIAIVALASGAAGVVVYQILLRNITRRAEEMAVIKSHQAMASAFNNIGYGYWQQFERSESSADMETDLKFLELAIENTHDAYANFGIHLGCVDISSEPYESTDEVQESQETR